MNLIFVSLKDKTGHSALPAAAGDTEKFMASFQALRRLTHRSGGQTFTAAGTTGSKDPATANGGFAGTKPMTTFAYENAWLICAFHGRTPRIGDCLKEVAV